MTATNQELADAIRRLQEAPGFRVYVRTLWSAREKAIQKCMYADTPFMAEAFRNEARAHDLLLKELRNNGIKEATHDSTSSSPPAV